MDKEAFYEHHRQRARRMYRTTIAEVITYAIVGASVVGSIFYSGFDEIKTRRALIERATTIGDTNHNNKLETKELEQMAKDMNIYHKDLSPKYLEIAVISADSDSLRAYISMKTGVERN